MPAEIILVNPLEEAEVRPRPVIEVGGYGDSAAPKLHELIVQLAKLLLSKPAFVKPARACQGENAIHKVASTRKYLLCVAIAIKRVKKFIPNGFKYSLSRGEDSAGSPPSS